MSRGLKLPGEMLSPAERVIASGFGLMDDPVSGEYEVQVYLVLRPEPSYYEVVVYRDGEREGVLGTFRNIVPAVEEYNDYGGFY